MSKMRFKVHFLQDYFGSSLVAVSITLANVVHAQKTNKYPFALYDSLLTAFWTSTISKKIYVEEYGHAEI
jgi:predicted nucleic acid-binding protein